MPWGQWFVTGISLLACMGVTGAAVGGGPLNEYKRALVDYYGAVHYHPLLLPEKHRVGDVIDIQTLAVLRGQEVCFPGLKTKNDNKISLPRIKQLESQEASGWVKLKNVLGIQIRSEDTGRILLNLEQVSVESATLDDLKTALSSRCTELSPIFEKNQLATVMGRRAVIVAGILKGRVNTVFSFSGSVQAKAKLEDLAKWLGSSSERLQELSPELAAQFGLAGRVNVIDEASRVQTVAYRPATIFRPRLGGGGKDIDVEPFDAEIEVHQVRLRLLADAWAESTEDRQ